VFSDLISLTALATRIGLDHVTCRILEIPTQRDTPLGSGGL
jgi:hypothetical protein